MRLPRCASLSAISLLLFGGMTTASSANDLIPVRSETVYVPAYSHIHTHVKNRQALASTLVVHNVDPEGAIDLASVRYHDREGKLVRSFLTAPTTLQPFQSSSFLTQISETEGGVGANYVVEWRAVDCALPPVIEAVMIGGSGTHGISFTSSGRVIDRDGNCP